MSIFRRPGSRYLWYEFEYLGVRYRGPTGQAREPDARAVEAKRRLEVRAQAQGIAAPAVIESPRFQDWAEQFYLEMARRVKRPEAKAFVIQAVLRFWGAKPSHPKKIRPGAPYHDRRLGDVITDPTWIQRWERWLEDSGIAPQTRNHYRSVVSQMYRIAMHPTWRPVTGVLVNPFADQWRDPTIGRQVVLDRSDLLAILGQASWHLRLAMAIALLAPKLRVANILALEWGRHVAADYSRIEVRDHKTDRRTRAPLVVYVPAQLRIILAEAHRRAQVGNGRVITYQGKPLKHLVGAVRGAVERAARSGRPHLRYGRAAATGITFHTLRHTAATYLAQLEVAPEKRQRLLGHQDLATTMHYTHLDASVEGPAAEQLSQSLQIHGIVLQRRRRPPVGDSEGTRCRRRSKLLGNRE